MSRRGMRALAALALCATASAPLAAGDAPRADTAAVGIGPGVATLAAQARQDLRAAARAQARAERALAMERDDALATLAALDRLGRAPPLAFFAHPDGPTGAARAASVLRAMAPALMRRRDDLRRALTALLDAQAGMRRHADALAAVARTSRAAVAPTPTPRPRADAALHSAIAALGSTGAMAAPRSTGATAAPGSTAAIAAPGSTGRTDETPPPPWPLPAPGAATMGRDGRLALRPAAHAAVRTPWVATVRHTGRPRDDAGDGATVVLEPAAGVLVAFSGVATVAAGLGETLRAGAPFAAMGGPPPADDDFLIDETARPVPFAPQTLYVSMWIDGTPADPAEWFAMDGERTTW